MATRKQKLIAMFGLTVYKDLMKVLRELRQADKGLVTLRSIEIDGDGSISPEKRREIERLFHDAA
jgi:hypothetical protein